MLGVREVWCVIRCDNYRLGRIRAGNHRVALGCFPAFADEYRFRPKGGHGFVINAHPLSLQLDRQHLCAFWIVDTKFRIPVISKSAVNANVIMGCVVFDNQLGCDNGYRFALCQQASNLVARTRWRISTKNTSSSIASSLDIISPSLSVQAWQEDQSVAQLM